MLHDGKNYLLTRNLLTQGEHKVQEGINDENERTNEKKNTSKKVRSLSRFMCVKESQRRVSV